MCMCRILWGKIDAHVVEQVGECRCEDEDVYLVFLGRTYITLCKKMTGRT